MTAVDLSDLVVGFGLLAVGIYLGAVVLVLPVAIGQRLIALLRRSRRRG